MRSWCEEDVTRHPRGYYESVVGGFEGALALIDGALVLHDNGLVVPASVLEPFGYVPECGCRRMLGLRRGELTKRCTRAQYAVLNERLARYVNGIVGGVPIPDHVKVGDVIVSSRPGGASTSPVVYWTVTIKDVRAAYGHRSVTFTTTTVENALPAQLAQVATTLGIAGVRELEAMYPEVGTGADLLHLVQAVCDALA